MSPFSYRYLREANLFDVFFGQGTLPETFWIYPLRTVHYVNSRILMTMIALHISGALYHTFIMKDGLLRRMSFGRRWVGARIATTRIQTDPIGSAGSAVGETSGV